jgi:TIR domain
MVTKQTSTSEFRLITKIEDAITKARFFGVVLSPRSVLSRWVKKELELAMNMELQSDSVVVLPLLLEKCKIPLFLQPKLYADFSSPDAFAESLEKLLRRLAFTDT